MKFVVFLGDHRRIRYWATSGGLLVRLFESGRKLVARANRLRCSSSEDGGTARFASKLIGEREVMREQLTNSRSGGPIFASDHRSVSKSMQHVAESAVLPSEIEQLPDLHGYLKLASQPEWRRVKLPSRT
jgi:hypothetical protein